MNFSRFMLATCLAGASASASAGFVIDTDALTYTGTLSINGGAPVALGDRFTITPGAPTFGITGVGGVARDLQVLVGSDIPSFYQAGAGIPSQFFQTVTGVGYTTQSAAPLTLAPDTNPNAIVNGYLQVDQDIYGAYSTASSSGSWNADKTVLSFATSLLSGNSAQSWNGGASNTSASLSTLTLTSLSLNGALTFASAATLDGTIGAPANWYSQDQAPTSVSGTLAVSMVDGSGNIYAYNLTLGGPANNWAVQGGNNVYAFSGNSAATAIVTHQGLLPQYYGAHVVPAPATLGLFGLGLVAMALRRRQPKI